MLITINAKDISVGKLLLNSANQSDYCQHLVFNAMANSKQLVLFIYQGGSNQVVGEKIICRNDQGVLLDAINNHLESLGRPAITAQQLSISKGQGSGLLNVYIPHYGLLGFVDKEPRVFDH